MKDSIRAMRTEILALASRPEGALMTDLRKLGYTDKQLTNVLYPLKEEGLIWSFRIEHTAKYFETEARMLESKAAWEAGAADRLRQRERDKYAKKVQNPEWVAYQAQKKAESRGRQRDAAIAAGTLVPRKPRPPKPAAAPKPQKPCMPATVTIKSTGRGPAYLPGEPDFSKAKYTYGRSPVQPPRTNTHSEVA